MSDVVLESWPSETPVHLDYRRGAWLKAIAVSALLAGVIALPVFASRLLPAPTPAASATPTVAPPPWREILKPVKIYSLQAAAFAGAPATYTARAHAPGGGREDVLTFGRFEGDGAALRLRIFRRNAEASDTTALRDTLSREAANLGLDIAHLGPADALPTRLGRFDIADVDLHGADGVARPCAGFGLALDSPAMSIVGLACGRRAARLSRTDVGCLLERLDVASARDDSELIDYFAASELRRNSACVGMRLGPDGLHAPWLDDKPIPPTPKSRVASGKPATFRRSLRHH